MSTLKINALILFCMLILGIAVHAQRPVSRDTIQYAECWPSLGYLNLDAVCKAIGYPPAAKAAHITGVVEVNVLVDSLGNVEKFVIDKKAPPLLAKAVAAHVKELKFIPCKNGPTPIETWTFLPFHFREGATCPGSLK